MSYRVVRTETADAQIHSIILRIADKFGIDTALDRLAEMEEAMMRLADTPQMGVVPRYTALRRRGYRVLILPKNLVFYRIYDMDQTIVIYAVMDQRQDYKSILEGL